MIIMSDADIDYLIYIYCMCQIHPHCHSVTLLWHVLFYKGTVGKTEIPIH